MGTTRFIWDTVSDYVLEEKDETGATKVQYTVEPEPYGRLISQDFPNGDVRYHHYDGQGNTLSLTDENGNTTDEYEYTGFGEELKNEGSTPNRYRYGGEHGYQTDDATDRIYVRARMYEPKIARWTSQDPLRFADGSNLFVYTGNSPTDRVDPSALKAICCKCEGLVSTFYEGTGCIGRIAPCCKRACSGLTTSYCGEFSDVPQLLPPDKQQRPKPAKPKAPNPFGAGYGHYCGLHRKARCLENKCAKDCTSRWVPDYGVNPPPIDTLDAICEKHDCCLRDVAQFSTCWTKCNDNWTCNLIDALDCLEEYPRVNQTVERGSRRL